MTLTLGILIGLAGFAVIWTILRVAARLSAPKEKQGRDFLREALGGMGADTSVLVDACLEEIVLLAVEDTKTRKDLEDPAFNAEIISTLNHFAAQMARYMEGEKPDEGDESLYEVLVKRGVV
jgi:DNA primase large subunit